MKSMNPYKVLWVDDDENIVKSTQLIAEDYNLELVHFTNWEEAENSLKRDFDEYSAIILDANCKIKKNALEQEEFITAVLPSLLTFFGEKRRILPWYLLSAGTMSTFNFIVTGADYQHSKHKEEWGNMLYLKDAIDGSEECSSKLFENIKKVAKDQAMNVVLYRHSNIFTYLGKDKVIDSRARKVMLKMLSALYYPEENIKYEYAGNPLRKVIEYVFRSAHKHGLLPDECIYSKDHIVLLDASRFMAGLNINCYEDRTIKYMTRWGNPGDEKDGKGGESIFSPEIATIVQNAINYSNSDSHTKRDEPYFIDEVNKEYFFAYVMQLCHLIKWFGNYVENHADVEVNRKKHQIIPCSKKNIKPIKEENINPSIQKQIQPKSELIGKKFLIPNDNNISVLYKLSDNLKGKKGVITITNLIDNEGIDKEKYPYIITELEQ